eukprot:GEMP01012795.1.p1 GENE.GEMP01012795.1~~GEMP01012795.1.p1  ORF type:complete len:794 (+),score=176.34 GEMP01012795.1:32-2383(+)
MLFAATLVSSLAVASPGPVRIPLTKTSSDAYDPDDLFREVSALSSNDRLDAPSNHSGLVPIHDYANSLYYGPIKLGTPKPGKHLPEINVVFDTASANLWVPSAACTSCDWFRNKNLYDHNSSTAYVPYGKHFHLDYSSSTGSVEGYLSYDSFHIGDDVKLDQLEFAEVTDASGMGLAYKVERYDGILGLGFDALAVGGVPTVISSLVDAKVIAKPIVGISLGVIPGQDGEIMLGDIDRNAFVGDLHFTPVDSSEYWRVKASEIWVAGPDKNKKSQLIVANQAVTLASGTPLLAMPQEHLKVLAERIGAKSVTGRAYFIDCSTTFAVEMVINNTPYTLTEKELTKSLVFGWCLLLVSSFKEKSGEPMWILGHSFMRKYYTVLDYGKREIGFAESSVKIPPPTLAAPSKKLLRIPVKKLGTTTSKHPFKTLRTDVPIHDFNNAQYYGSIDLGSSTQGKQTLSVIFDTGSANLWVPSKNCTNCNLPGVAVHVLYDHDASDKYIPDGAEFNIEYASGVVSGFLSFDAITLSDVELESVHFAEITDVSGLGMAYTLGKFDGILGMGWDSISVHGIPTIFKMLVDEGKIDKPIFSFSLGRTEGQDGELILGGTDPSLYTGDLHYTPLTKTGYWQIDVDDITVGETSLGKNMPAIVDSGTSLIVGPEDGVAQLKKAIGAFTFWGKTFVRCKTSWTMTFVIGESEYTFDNKALTMPMYFGYCLLLVMPIDMPVWILGDTFMRKYYTVFDWGEKRVGFALSSVHPADIPIPSDIPTPPPTRKEDLKESTIIF